MFQSHLLQLLCLVTMEEPAALDETHFRDRKIELLRAVRAAEPADDLPGPVRARYEAGRIDDREIPAYVDARLVDVGRDLAVVDASRLVPGANGPGQIVGRLGGANGTQQLDLAVAKVSFVERGRLFHRDEAQELEQMALDHVCLLYTSDAADDL